MSGNSSNRGLPPSNSRAHFLPQIKSRYPPPADPSQFLGSPTPPPDILTNLIKVCYFSQKPLKEMPGQIFLALPTERSRNPACWGDENIGPSGNVCLKDIVLNFRRTPLPAVTPQGFSSRRTEVVRQRVVHKVKVSPKKRRKKRQPAESESESSQSDSSKSSDSDSQSEDERPPGFFTTDAIPHRTLPHPSHVQDTRRSTNRPVEPLGQQTKPLQQPNKGSIRPSPRPSTLLTSRDSSKSNRILPELLPPSLHTPETAPKPPKRVSHQSSSTNGPSEQSQFITKLSTLKYWSRWMKVFTAIKFTQFLRRIYKATLDTRRAECDKFYTKTFDKMHQEFTKKIKKPIINVIENLLKVRKDLDIFSQSNNREMANAVTTIIVCSTGPQQVAHQSHPVRDLPNGLQAQAVPLPLLPHQSTSPVTATSPSLVIGPPANWPDFNWTRMASFWTTPLVFST